MSEKITAVRGMKDILPTETPLWQFVEKTCQTILKQYAYQEIRFPIVEKTQLFKRSVGEATDIVEKEMYTFEDRNGDSLSLRPEGTAACMRAGIEHGLFYNQIAKLWYYGPLFRHERPQKGRYRQFYQCGVEACGISDPEIDAEVILISARILKGLGLLKQVNLQLNSLGSSEDRAHYRNALINYFKKHPSQLDEDSVRRLDTNPLRILDSKNPDMKALIESAPKLNDYLGDEAKVHFEKLKSILDQAGIAYTVNPTLVRGLDYYSLTVFEWVTDQLGAQGTVCAGGRYDGLIEQLGGKPCPGIGFAMGIERVVALLEDLKLAEDVTAHPDAYIISLCDAADGVMLAEKLRDANPALSIQCGLSNASMKNQLKKADKSSARMALILGEEEIANQTITVKFLREDTPQQSCNFEQLLSLF